MDALAVCFGTAHGIYAEPPLLDIERVKAIRAAMPKETRVVMHGGSGVDEEQVRAAITAGCSKVNYYSYMATAASRHIREYLNERDGKAFWHEVEEESYRFTDKETMFETLAAKFEAAGIVTDAKQYIKALEERETLGSTYMGNMIALPHGKCDAVVKLGIGFCRCKQTFRYCSHDEEGDVRYVFMLAIAANQSSDQYLRVLATLAGLLTHEEFIEVLEHAQSYEEIIQAINTLQSNCA